MEESIFGSIRSMIGGIVLLPGETGPFDADLKAHINTVLGFLNQLGVGKEGFRIEDDTETWHDFVGEQEEALGITLSEVIDYVYIRVKLLFDTPTSSVLVQNLKESYDEIGWRMMTKIETAQVVN